ncbi:hypothetical protein OSTOST_01477, partial [Ostertagia ostertagi]
VIRDYAVGLNEVDEECGSTDILHTCILQRLSLNSTTCRCERYLQTMNDDLCKLSFTNATKTIMELMKEVENEGENVSQPLSASSTAQAVQECYNDQLWPLENLWQRSDSWSVHCHLQVTELDKGTFRQRKRMRVVHAESKPFSVTDDLLLAASMAATVFNVMVIFCAVKLFKRSGDTMHLFILNMTVGDLILTVFCHPNELLIRKHDFLQQIHLCAVVHYFNWTGLAVSGLSLTMLNIDKSDYDQLRFSSHLYRPRSLVICVFVSIRALSCLIYFRWPLNYDRSMSKRRAALFCLLIWGLSV